LKRRENERGHNVSFLFCIVVIGVNREPDEGGGERERKREEKGEGAREMRERRGREGGGGRGGRQTDHSEPEVIGVSG